MKPPQRQRRRRRRRQAQTLLLLVLVPYSARSWVLPSFSSLSSLSSLTRSGLSPPNHQRHYYYDESTTRRRWSTNRAFASSALCALLDDKSTHEYDDNEHNGTPTTSASVTPSINTTTTSTTNITSIGLSDTEFEAWFLSELQQHPLSEVYPTLFVQAAKAVTNWRRRYRGNAMLWKRLFKKERVMKEFVEAAPILDALQTYVLNYSTTTNHHAPITILDLASGKGYLSMFLSELLPPHCVTKCLLMDKQWAMCGTQELQAHHINWDHIYGLHPETGSCYFDTWPIPLHTSKQNLKSNSDKKHLAARFIEQAPGPVAIVAVHLCGTLAFSAVELMNLHPTKVQFWALKPCCLPDYSLHKTTLRIPPDYTFAGADVCAMGQWNRNQWKGPPRWHLEHRFHIWCRHLYQGMDVPLGTQKRLLQVPVQLQGGYQNTFLLAQRSTNNNGEAVVVSSEDKNNDDAGA